MLLDKSAQNLPGGSMANKHEQLAKSRLGRLLVNRGYISESQLDEALKLQASQGCLLGEVLLEQGWITKKELSRTLNHQKRYRFAAAMVTMATAPLQPMMAFAASPVPALPIQASAKMQIDESQMGKFSGMKMLDDEALAGVNAQGFGPGIANSMAMGLAQNADAVAAGLRHHYRDDEDYEEQSEEQIANQLADSVLTMVGVGPIAGLLDADISIEGLKYQEGRPNVDILADGGMKFYMPTEIKRISMENIRVKGNTSGPTMGNIYMSDIRYHPNSSFTIRAKQDRF